MTSGTRPDAPALARFDARPHRGIVALALPAMAALAADPLLGLVDTALVGRLGRLALAALGIDMAVFAAVFLVFNFLTYGTTAEVARLRGAGRPDEATRHALAALWLAVGLGALVTAVLLAGGPLILRVMGADAAVAPLALAYLRIRALAAIPVLVVAVGHGAFRGGKDMRTPLWITAGANAVNAILAWALIYPAGLGVAGAAWGTLLAQTGAASAFLLLGRRAFPAPGSLRVGRAAMRGVLRISTDLFLRTAALLTGLLMATAVAARMGTVTLAAHQIARELWAMLALVLDGFAIAGQAMISTALGAERPDQARADARRLLWWGLGAGTVIGLMYLALAGPLPRVFTAAGAVLAEVRGVWWIVAVLQPIGVVVFVLDGILLGAGDLRFLLVTTGAAALAGLAPVALLALTLGWGLAGIWTGMAVLMAVRLATTVPRLLGGRWLAVPAPAQPVTT
ncbi:MAG: MATE family efflux transporter [Egibacteraceae bacterium]